VIWAPRGASLPAAEPGLSEIALAAIEAAPQPDGRHEICRPVELYLRRTNTTGSVVTVLGGLAAHWAQFTNRVPGSFQLNSGALHRLPQDPARRDALVERVVQASQQPDVDETRVVSAEDCWSVTVLPGQRAWVVGSPRPEHDEQSATLRRDVRAALRTVERGPAANALVVLGAATYAEEEKLSWALRGMDPALYAGFEIVVVIADGVVKPLLTPARGQLPWDAPLGGDAG
jgi:hypothetical protein